MKFRTKNALLLAGCLWLPAACSTSPGPGGAATAELVPPPPAAAVNYSISNAAGPEELARQAVAHHPSILAAKHKAERLAARVPQERALPDPAAEVGAMAMAETTADNVPLSVGLRQTIPFPGKLQEAAAAAGSEAAAATAEIGAMELRLTEQVHAAWWDLFLSQQSLEITRESRGLLVAVRDSVEARVGADQATQGDLLRLGNEIATVDRDLAEAQQLQNTARARLNSLLNRPAGAPLPPARRTAVPTAGPLRGLLARAQARHPEVAAAEQRANAFRHRLKRAELEKYPDFTAGVGGVPLSDWGNGREQVAMTLGINIPLWQEPRRAMIREAREGIAETDALIASTRSDLRYRVEEAWFSVQTARDISTLFETRLIPDSRQAYEVTLTSYSAGTADFTALLETWRQYLSYRLQLARNQAVLGKASATLRAAAALP